MHILRTNNDYTNKLTTFNAKVSQHFQARAEHFLIKRYASPKPLDIKIFNNFKLAVNRFKSYGSNDTSIIYKKGYKNGERCFLLYAHKPGKSDVLLTSKNSFRKLIDKFSTMNNYEFDIKTACFKK